MLRFQRARMAYSDTVSTTEKITSLMQSEAGYVHAGDECYLADSMPQSSGAKMIMAHQLLVQCGFNGVFDPSSLPQQQFEQNLDQVKASMVRHKESVMQCVMPVFSDKPPSETSAWSSKDTLNFVNAIIRRVWGSRIAIKQGQYRLQKRPDLGGPKVTEFCSSDPNLFNTSL